jgi:hypothetical protein
VIKPGEVWKNRSGDLCDVAEYIPGRLVMAHNRRDKAGYLIYAETGLYCSSPESEMPMDLVERVKDAKPSEEGDDT